MWMYHFELLYCRRLNEPLAMLLDAFVEPYSRLLHVSESANVPMLQLAPKHDLVLRDAMLPIYGDWFLRRRVDFAVP